MTMQTTKQRSDGMTGFVDDLNGAIRDNPLAAGLIGMGVLWMLFGGARVSAFGKALPKAARSMTTAVGSAAEETGTVVSDAFSGAASRIGEAARHVGKTMASGAEEAATTVRENASAGYDAVKSKTGLASETVTRRAKEAVRASTELGRDLGLSMQQNLTETLRQQPALLGVIGLAVGAGIASAFPSTRLEQEMMGDAGGVVKDKIHEIASEASDRAKDVFNEVRKEASAQGLTPAAAKEGLRGIGTKLKSVAGASRDSIKDRLS